MEELEFCVHDQVAFLTLHPIHSISGTTILYMYMNWSRDHLAKLSSLYLCSPAGIPNDGVPIVHIVTVALPLTVVYVILGVAGIVFASICMAFNFIFRKRK